MSKLIDNVVLEDFISEIEKRPALWDHTSDDYCSKEAKRNAWFEVSKFFCPDFENQSTDDKYLIELAIQKKWRNLRTCYGRELGRQKLDALKGKNHRVRRPYIYFEKLRFLEAHVRNSNSNSLDDENEEDDDSDVNIERQKSRINSPIPKKISRKSKNTEKEVENNKKLKSVKETYTQTSNIEDEKEDRLFLLSLVSELNKVPKEQKLKVKSDILLAISNGQQNYQSQFFQVPLSQHSQGFSQSSNYNMTINPSLSLQNNFSPDQPSNCISPRIYHGRNTKSLQQNDIKFISVEEITTKSETVSPVDSENSHCSYIADETICS